jgi:hypothetical protein
MAQALDAGRGTIRAATGMSALTAKPVYQAYVILHIAFVILPILAGLDKFFGVLVDWDMYLAPVIAKVLPSSAHAFMLLVGAIEIVAGLIVAFWPRVGSWIVTLWLWGIVINLLLIPGFYDIALRDFGLSLGGLALARLSREFD